MKFTTLATLVVMSAAALAAPVNTETSPANPLIRRLEECHCKGSVLCSQCSRLSSLWSIVSQIDDDTEYYSGDKIACSNCRGSHHKGICVFVEKRDDPVTGRVVKEMVETLVSNDCGQCGACPVQDGLGGQITVNYVRKGCKTGIC